eukprot:SAG31_NODE_273_length_18667_cov_3.603619_10_plen_92_part_00
MLFTCRQVVSNQPQAVLALLQAGADPLLLKDGGLRLAPLFIAATLNDPGLLKVTFLLPKLLDSLRFKISFTQPDLLSIFRDRRRCTKVGQI